MNKLMYFLSRAFKFLLVVHFFFLAGCSSLSQLLTLKSYGDSQAEIKKHVEIQDKKFEKLVKVVNENRLKEYPDQRSFLKYFGEPIYTKNVIKEGQTLEEWMYRYAARFFNSEKVYLYFNGEGRLIDFKHILPKPEEEES